MTHPQQLVDEYVYRIKRHSNKYRHVPDALLDLCASLYAKEVSKEKTKTK